MFLEFLVAVAVSIALVVLYYRWNYGILEKLGIPVVKTHFLYGSQSDFHKVCSHDRDMEWFDKHGEIYGVYNGREPQIHIIDPEIVRQIFVKDFDKFTNRSFEIGNGAAKLFHEMMDSLKDEKWKTVRSAISPIYTTAKLKRMSTQMIEATEGMVKFLSDDIASAPNGVLQDCNIFQEIFSLVMDMAARCTMNIKIKNPRSPDNDFAKALAELFAELPSYATLLFDLFPWLPKITRLFTKKEPEGFFVNVFQQIMTERRKSQEKNDDFIDFMNHLVDRTKTPEFMKHNITELTIIAQAVGFFIAGIDGIVRAILIVILHSCKDPEISKKLYDEIDAYFLRNKGNIAHDNLGELKYLNACLYEALRLHPPFSRNDRRCGHDVEYKGLKIQKGMSVVVPLWPYNRNPKYFPNPDTFDPERFMPYNKDNIDMFNFFSFGQGPRMCIGMRFASECMLIIGAKLFQNFNFTVNSDAEVEYSPSVLPGFCMLNPFNVNVAKRC